MKLKKNRQKPPTPMRRKNRQKAKRLAHTEAMNVVSRATKKLRADTSLTVVRRVADESIVVGVRKGTFGHPGTVILRVDDLSLAGMIEEKAELAKFINNVGLLAVSQLFNYNLAEGLDGLGKHLAKWAGIDVDALLKAAAEDAADDDAPPSQPEPALETPVSDATSNETTPAL